MTVLVDQKLNKHWKEDVVLIIHFMFEKLQTWAAETYDSTVKFLQSAFVNTENGIFFRILK